MTKAHPATPGDRAALVTSGGRRDQLPSSWGEPFAASGVRFGLFLGLCMFTAWELASQPWGLIAFWTLVGVQALVGGWIVWRRLRLRHVASARVAIIMFSAAMALYSWH